MEQRIYRLGLLFLIIFFSYATSFLTHCEARRSLKHLRGPQLQAKALKKHLVTYYSTSDPNSNNYLGSPCYLPPFQDVMGPSSSPQENLPYCSYPLLNPLPPFTTVPSPVLPIQTAPPPPSTSTSTSPTPTQPTLSPPSPSIFYPNPPAFPTPSPPGFEPSPPEYIPGPPEFSPGPPIFLPPIVYPLPAPNRGTGPSLWCVAKPTVPDPIIQEAMIYACGSGADCDAIQPNGSCYQPDTVLAHASFAFNSYWQRTKGAGAGCDFGGTAVLVIEDPSYDGCRFSIN